MSMVVLLDNSKNSNVHGVLRATFCFQARKRTCKQELSAENSITRLSYLLNGLGCSETQTLMTSMIAFYFRSFYSYEVCSS